jgi:general L-amino acid transport system permease protein
MRRTPPRSSEKPTPEKSERLPCTQPTPIASSMNWHYTKMKRTGYQSAALLAVAAAIAYLVWNTAANLEARRIASGFGFLSREAGFEIGESLFLRYHAGESYLRALAVGLANTLAVSAIGIVLATALGTLLGLLRLSANFLLRNLSAAYIQFVRNVPLLVQLFFWYALINQLFPHPREALEPLPGVFLTNRGFYFPLPGNVPVLEGFNFTGGAALSPEFATLILGLVTYTAAFIAEIVRAGIASVRRGQVLAAYAVGLPAWPTMRFVVLPQALRVILPPMTSQYLNLTKNSSLAVAIGYPDLVSVANTMINQTGQAIEGIAVIMAVYLTLSLSISALMNWYNARVALR